MYIGGIYTLADETDWGLRPQSVSFAYESPEGSYKSPKGSSKKAAKRRVWGPKNTIFGIAVESC